MVLKAIDLRERFAPARDQKGLNSCVSMALADAIAFGLAEHVMTRQRLFTLPGESFVPSALFIHYNSRKALGHHNHNVAVEPEAALVAIAKSGICPDSMFPDAAADHRACPPQAAFEFADRFPKPVFERLTPEFEALCDSLYRNLPFFFCLRLCASNAREFRFGETARTGRIACPGPNEEAVHNHAMLCVGYDPSQENFIVRNSLGKRWGDHGYALVPADYLCAHNRAYGFRRLSQSHSFSSPNL